MPRSSTPTLSPASPLIQELPEHFDARDHRLLRRLDSDDLDFVADLHDATLDPARYHRTPARDREHVFERHEIGLVDVALRLGYVAVDRGHELQDALVFRRIDILAFALEGF